MANTAAKGALRASVVADTGDGLQVDAVPGVAGAGQTATLASFTAPAGAQRVILVITNQGKTSDDAASPTSYRVTVGTAGEVPTATPTATPSVTPTPCPGGGCTYFAYLPLVGTNYNFHDLPPSLTR